MERFPNPKCSAAVLIGVSEYTVMNPLQVVENNLRDLSAVLRSENSWNLPDLHCVEVHNPRTAGELIEPIEAAADHATDTLLVYYAGHGILGPTDLRLHLSLVGSRPGRPYLSVLYDHVRHAVLNTRAARRILVLDCCFAAQAFDQALSDDPASMVARQAFIEGTCILAAAANNLAASADGDRHTAFTGALLKALDPYTVDASDILDVGTVFARARFKLVGRGQPRPEIMTINDAAALALVRGRRQPKPQGQHLPVVPPRRSAPIRIRPWRFHISGTSPTPVLGSGFILISGNPDQVIAVQPDDGQLRWRREFPVLAGNPPAIAGNEAFVAGGDQHLWALDSVTGEPRWRMEFTAPFSSPPSVVAAYVLVGTQVGEVVAVDRESGQLCWWRRLLQPVHGPMSTDGQLIYFAGHDCHVRAWTTDGEEVWQFGSRKWFDAPPAVSRDAVFVGGYDRRLYRLDRITGEPVWYYSARDLIKRTPVVVDDLVIFGGHRGMVFALDVETGELRWTYPSEARVKAALAYRDGVVYIATGAGILHAVESRTGRLRWRRTFPAALNVAPVVVDSLVIVGTDSGYVYAVDAATGHGSSA